MITGLTRLIRPFRRGLVEYRIRNAVLPALVGGWEFTRSMNSQVARLTLIQNPNPNPNLNPITIPNIDTIKQKKLKFTLNPNLTQVVCNTPYFTRVVHAPARDPGVKEKENKTDNDMVKDYALETLRNLKGFLRRVSSDDYKHFDIELRGSIGTHFR